MIQSCFLINKGNRQMPIQPKARIVGMGSFLPERILTNQDLEEMVETTDDWIVSRTGIKERRIAGNHETPSLMGFYAAQKALQESSVPAADIDMVLVATMTPDYITPSTAAIIQAKLGASSAAALDIQAACTGFLYGLSIAKAYIEAGIYRNILLIASEKLSTIINYKDRNTCVLFGDGAAAAVISNRGKGFSLDAFCLGSDGEVAELLMIPAGGARQPSSVETVTQGLHFLKMEGKEVFKHAVRRMGAAAKECLVKAGITEEEIDWLVPHQANIRIIEALAKSFNLPSERVYKTLHKYGNTSASSVAIALEELKSENQFSNGEKLLLVGFGAGLTWAAAVVTQIDDLSSSFD
ncbi:3-oxoacyl-[acyl-carrier-protein] synthase 3|nr:3-oxoacyl-[acyl-carrier-protein] synthase 3 [Neochlamydia sp. AcF84]